MPMDNYNFRFDLTAEMPLLTDLWPENGLFVSSDDHDDNGDTFEKIMNEKGHVLLHYARCVDPNIRFIREILKLIDGSNGFTSGEFARIVRNFLVRYQRDNGGEQEIDAEKRLFLLLFFWKYYNLITDNNLYYLYILNNPRFGFAGLTPEKIAENILQKASGLRIDDLETTLYSEEIRDPRFSWIRDFLQTGIIFNLANLKNLVAQCSSSKAPGSDIVSAMMEPKYLKDHGIMDARNNIRPLFFMELTETLFMNIKETGKKGLRIFQCFAPESVVDDIYELLIRKRAEELLKKIVNQPVYGAGGNLPGEERPDSPGNIMFLVFAFAFEYLYIHRGSIFGKASGAGAVQEEIDREGTGREYGFDLAKASGSLRGLISELSRLRIGLSDIFNFFKGTGERAVRRTFLIQYVYGYYVNQFIGFVREFIGELPVTADVYRLLYADDKGRNKQTLSSHDYDFLHVLLLESFSGTMVRSGVDSTLMEKISRFGFSPVTGGGITADDIVNVRCYFSPRHLIFLKKEFQTTLSGLSVGRSGDLNSYCLIRRKNGMYILVWSDSPGLPSSFYRCSEKRTGYTGCFNGTTQYFGMDDVLCDMEYLCQV